MELEYLIDDCYLFVQVYDEYYDDANSNNTHDTA